MPYVHIQPNRRQHQQRSLRAYEDKEVRVKSLKSAFQPALEPAKIFVPKFKVGQPVRVDDQFRIIAATVYSISVPNRYEVIDDQGFIHVTAAVENPIDGEDLRCIVSPNSKVSAGYHPVRAGSTKLS